MKNLILFCFIITNIQLANAQSNSNLFEIGTNTYHFSNTKWDALSEVNIAYTKSFTDSKFGLRSGVSFFFKEYSYTEGLKLNGVTDRNFFIGELLLQYKLADTENSNFVLFAGPVFRLGSENTVVSITDGDVFNQAVIQEFKTTGPGIMAAIAYNFQIMKKVNLKIESGAHQFFQKEGTKFDFYGGLKAGFLF